MAGPLIARLTRHVPPGQLGRYLVVGAWNTLFGYGSFALFTAALDRYMPFSYLAAGLLSSLLSITVAFLFYKWFVFKTRGNYLREWARCVLLYGGLIVMGVVLLPPTVFVVGHFIHDQRAAPYLAGGLVTGVNVLVSFFGHKHFSFQNIQRTGMDRT